MELLPYVAQYESIGTRTFLQTIAAPDLVPPEPRGGEDMSGINDMLRQIREQAAGEAMGLRLTSQELHDRYASVPPIDPE
jgi:hypothetical protein